MTRQRMRLTHLLLLLLGLELELRVSFTTRGGALFVAVRGASDTLLEADLLFAVELGLPHVLKPKEKKVIHSQTVKMEQVRFVSIKAKSPYRHVT